MQDFIPFAEKKGFYLQEREWNLELTEPSRTGALERRYDKKKRGMEKNAEILEMKGSDFFFNSLAGQ